MVDLEGLMDRALEARLNAAKDRKRSLVATEASLREKLHDVRVSIAACDREITLCEAADQERKRGNVVQHELRATVRRLGVFTVSELAAELGVKNPTARKHLAAMEAAGMVQGAGRSLGQTLYQYVKPTEAGGAFEQQRALRVVPDESVGTTRSLPVAGTGSMPWDAIAAKPVREAVRDACRAGWQLKKKGDGHWNLIKDGRKVGVAGTPANPDGAADVIRRATRRAS